MKFTFLIAMLLSSATLNAIACVQEGPRRGYWFYNECASETHDEEDEYALPELPPHDQLMQAHPSEIEKMMEERLQYAVYKMTPEAVVDYYKVVDVARRKSLAFTSLTKLVMLQNPALNAKAQNPVTVPARNASTLMRNNEYASYIATQSRGFALVMFTKEGCQYCMVQEASLKHFQAKYGWKYRTIDIDLNPQIAMRFNATVVPTTAVIKMGTDEWMPVSVGAESVSEIEVGVYRSLRMLNGEISPTQYIMDGYREGGFFDPDTREGL
jgi:conjugal transfer pilus assembly protein TraF